MRGGLFILLILVELLTHSQTLFKLSFHINMNVTNYTNSHFIILLMVYGTFEFWFRPLTRNYAIRLLLLCKHVVPVSLLYFNAFCTFLHYFFFLFFLQTLPTLSTEQAELDFLMEAVIMRYKMWGLVLIFNLLSILIRLTCYSFWYSSSLSAIS